MILVERIFALPLFLVSIGSIYAAFEKQKVQYPNFRWKRRIKKNNCYFECRSCKKSTLVEWK